VVEASNFLLNVTRVDALNCYLADVADTREREKENLVFTYVVVGTPPFDIQSHILRIVFRRAIMFDIGNLEKRPIAWCF
jgi:hypothetical protein